MLGLPPDSHWASWAHTPSGAEPPPESDPPSDPPESDPPESEPLELEPEPPELEPLDPEEVLGSGRGAGRSAVPTSTIRSSGSVVTSTLTCLVRSEEHTSELQSRG